MTLNEQYELLATIHEEACQYNKDKAAAAGKAGNKQAHDAYIGMAYYDDGITLYLRQGKGLYEACTLALARWEQVYK